MYNPDNIAVTFQVAQWLKQAGWLVPQDTKTGTLDTPLFFYNAQGVLYNRADALRFRQDNPELSCILDQYWEFDNTCYSAPSAEELIDALPLMDIVITFSLANKLWFVHSPFRTKAGQYAESLSDALALLWIQVKQGGNE